MKRFSIILAILVAVFLTVAIASAQLSEAKNVYVLPMSGGLDQHLALRLTEDRVLQVVTDPEKADVLLSDRIGAGFDAAFKELYAPPPTEDENGAIDTFAPPAMRPMSRSRGAVFLIERSTKNVLWSTFEEPKSTEAKELYKAAERVVQRLAKAMKTD